MPKICLVLVEGEGSERMIAEAIRSFSAVPVGALLPRPDIAAPIVEGPALPARAGSTAVPQLASRKPAGGGKAKRSPAPPPSPLAAGGDSGCTAAIVEALVKGPRTSAELISVTRFSSGSVYPALVKLRAAGRIEMVGDPEDGQRKNKLVG